MKVFLIVELTLAPWDMDTVAERRVLEVLSCEATARTRLAQPRREFGVWLVMEEWEVDVGMVSTTERVIVDDAETEDCPS